MRYWALQYGEYAEGLEPESLRDEIRGAVDCMGSVYRQVACTNDHFCRKNVPHIGGDVGIIAFQSSFAKGSKVILMFSMIGIHGSELRYNEKI